MIYDQERMRIGDLNPTPVNPSATPSAGKSAGDAGRDSAPAPNDAVELSRLSQAVAEPGASDTRIEEIRNAVQAGTYQVPPSELAKNIVDFHTK